nr:unnamed protein product [Digitaria exilis]
MGLKPKRKRRQAGRVSAQQAPARPRAPRLDLSRSSSRRRERRLLSHLRRADPPNTLLTHASYAFNIFYQQNGNSDIACSFGGVGALVKCDLSFGSCKFLAQDFCICFLGDAGKSVDLIV